MKRCSKRKIISVIKNNDNFRQFKKKKISIKKRIKCGLSKEKEEAFI